MPRRLSVLSALLFAGISALFAADPQPALRTPGVPKIVGVQFGVSRDEIRQLYTTRSGRILREYPDSIVYRSPLVELPEVTGVMYLFTRDDKLAQITVFFDCTSTDPSATGLINSYQRFKDALTKKYGAARSNDTIESNYNTAENRLLGLQTGHASFSSLWNLNQMAISLVLRGDTYTLSYEYTPLFQQYQREKDQILQDNL